MSRPRPYADFSKMVPVGICLLLQSVMLTTACGAGLYPAKEENIASILVKIKAAYARVEDYQMETEVKVYNEGQAVETKRFLYTFSKPDHIRIDMESPYAGTVLIYPDEDGKVTVKPGGLFGFLKLHFSPDSSLLNTSKGQRIDQTDMGLLIKNIEHSLTDRGHGEISISERDGRVRIAVLADDHFLTGVLTLYHFFIDRTLWMPVEVREFTPNGIIKREVRFRDLRTSVGVPESFFQINGGGLGHAQSNR